MACNIRPAKRRVCVGMRPGTRFDAYEMQCEYSYEERGDEATINSNVAVICSKRVRAKKHRGYVDRCPLQNALLFTCMGKLPTRCEEWASSGGYW